MRNNMDTPKNPEQMSESPERKMATARETAERLKSYGGVLGAVGKFTEKQLDRTEKINSFAETANKAYSEGKVQRVDNMYLKGTQLEKMGALKATTDRVKDLNDNKLKEIVQNKACGRLERTCAKKILEKRLEQNSVNEGPKKKIELQHGE